MWYIVTDNVPTGKSMIIDQAESNYNSMQDASNFHSSTSPFRKPHKYPYMVSNEKALFNLFSNYRILPNFRELMDAKKITVMELGWQNGGKRITNSNVSSYLVFRTFANSLREDAEIGRFISTFSNEIPSIIEYSSSIELVQHIGLKVPAYWAQARAKFIALCRNKASNTNAHTLHQKVLEWITAFPDDVETFEEFIEIGQYVLDLAKLYPERRSRYIKRLMKQASYTIRDWLKEFPDDAEYVCEKSSYSAWLLGTIARDHKELYKKAADRIQKKDIGTFSKMADKDGTSMYLLEKHGLIDMERYEKADRTGKMLMRNLAYTHEQASKQRIGRWRFFTMYCNLLDTEQFKANFDILKKFLSDTVTSTYFIDDTRAVYQEGIYIILQKRSELICKTVGKIIMKSGARHIKATLTKLYTKKEYKEWPMENCLGGDVFKGINADRELKKIMMEVKLKARK